MTKTMAWMETAGRKAWVYWAVFGVLLVFHAGMNAWWLHADNHAIRTDEESHMTVARAYYDTMFVQTHENMVAKLVAITNIPLGYPAHPPLLHVLGALLMAVCGYGVDVMASLNTLSFLLLLLGMLLIVRRFMPPWDALYTVFVISFTPAIFAFSRYFMTDYLSMVIVVWAIYALMRTEWFMNTPWVFAFALLNGLGILSRTTTFLYFLIPSAIIAAAGLWSAVRSMPGEGVANRRLGLWMFNCVLTIVVTVGVFSPWYFKHLDEYYSYWIKRHSGSSVALFESKETPPAPVSTEAAPAPPAPASQESPPSSGNAPAPAEAAVPSAAAPSAAEATVPPAAAPSAEETQEPAKQLRLYEQLVHPLIGWGKYPRDVHQEMVFMPIFLLAVAGLLIAFFFARYRRFDVFLILVWLLGSWAYLTVIMRYSTPRYSLQAIPALAVFTAITVMAPKRNTLRAASMGLFAVFLLFQYGNLTLAPYGPLRELSFYTHPLKLACTWSPPPDVVIYKDYLAPAFSDTRIGAPVKENFKDALFGALMRAEQQQLNPKGEYANYLRLNIRGLLLEQEHYWPGSPYQRKDINPRYMPKRKFRNIGQYWKPEDLIPRIDAADYIVYAIDSMKPEQEREWLEKLDRYGFQQFERFQEKRLGVAKDQTYGVLVRRAVSEAVTIRTPEDIDKLNLMQLYQFRNTLGLAREHPDLKSYADARFERMIQDLDARPFKVHDSLMFISADVNRFDDNWFAFRFIFKVTGPIEKDYRMFFHGYVAPKDIPRLPKNFQDKGCMMWNFDPEPPTHSWPVNDYVILTHRIKAEPIVYKLNIGFTTPGKNELFGSNIPLGEIDFGAVQ